MNMILHFTFAYSINCLMYKFSGRRHLSASLSASRGGRGGKERWREGIVSEAGMEMEREDVFREGWVSEEGRERGLTILKGEMTERKRRARGSKQC